MGDRFGCVEVSFVLIQLMRLWYLSHSRPELLRRACASAQSRQSLRCSHTWSMKVDEGSDQKSEFSSTGWLRKRVWRMSLRGQKVPYSHEVAHVDPAWMLRGSACYYYHCLIRLPDTFARCNTSIFLYAFSMNSKPIISQFQSMKIRLSNGHCLWLFFFHLYFMNSRLKVLPKRSKCSIRPNWSEMARKKSLFSDMRVENYC